ncbi:uncharacterized protein AB675_278 [Cyphellophora attinorum]|uniref:Cep57 centrosome microtubule-binding domain-containing protein n=1 Tax=Cyphellophora attinorum TaxID=1664694 RepID=A0A0N1HB42_9EURO|nr:uncharacterized protein AB675_278 [Phialophora attinorum]KPI45613.1 hypothetical protein AB675_278 [Phialophora attinorum]
MPVDAGVHDRGTYFSNYSSIHSIDAYVGRQQVMYTPGSSPPVNRRAKGSSRFRTKQNTVSQSIMMPANMPNSSQILPERGSLRDVHVHYNIPADEKQIVASLRALQEQLDNALVQISDLTKERDDARHELKRLRETTKKRTSFAKRFDEEEHSHIEEELFDLSRVSDSPKLSPQRIQKSTASKSTQKTTTDKNARLISHISSKRVASHSPNHDRHMSKDNDDKRSSKRAMVQDTEESLNADITAASNISRRRRPSLDDNMTSAYIIPDITLALKHQQQQHAQEQQKRKSSEKAGALSTQAQAILHEHDPQHIASCDVCQRLTHTNKTKPTNARANSEPPKSSTAKAGEYTAHLNIMMRDMALDELTARPKIPPTHALAHMKKLLNDQYEQAKEKHGIAWERYDAIDAPQQSKKHSAIAEDLRVHAAKMEECRVNLDQLRDVEEGMKRSG